jgi:hypothetical protein
MYGIITSFGVYLLWRPFGLKILPQREKRFFTEVREAFALLHAAKKSYQSNKSYKIPVQTISRCGKKMPPYGGINN